MVSSRTLHMFVTRLIGSTLLLAVLAGATPLAAMSYVQMADADLAGQADGAVEATVSDEPQPVLDLGGVRIATRYTLEVSDDMGRTLPAHVTAEVPGWQGPDENAAWQVPGMVSLKHGDRIVLVYQRRADGVLLPVHLNLGVFIEQGAGTARYLDRALEDSVNASPKSHAEYGAARDPLRFRQYLRNQFAGIESPVDYLFPLPAPARPKHTSLTGGGKPVRWFEFDQGRSVEWRANSDGQLGMVHDEFALLHAALMAWNHEATSNINFVFAGPIAPGAAAPTTSAGRVSWNDPFNEIAGTFDCAAGGVLAVGGPSMGGAPTVYRGVSYYRIVSSRITTQDGAGCFFDGHNGASGAMVFGHEIGHSLGFGHSCGDAQSPTCESSSMLNDALMRATTHGDARGAWLGVDDIAAASQWYSPLPRDGRCSATLPDCVPRACESGHRTTAHTGCGGERTK